MTAWTDSILTGEVGEKLNFPLVTFDDADVLVDVVELVADEEAVVVTEESVVTAVVEPDVVQLMAVVAVDAVELVGDWTSAGTYIAAPSTTTMAADSNRILDIISSSGR